MATVLIPLAAGVEEMEAVIMADVLRRGGLEVTLVSLLAGRARAQAAAHAMLCTEDF